ncbi:MAG: hypothetical protein AB2535_20435 [Candidatus Thiodiazotropha endolucinida]
MDTTQLKNILKNALEKYAKYSYQELLLIGEEHIFEEHGDPTHDINSYWQIELDVLQKWLEDGVEVLQVPVRIRDGEGNVLGGDLYFRSDGVVEISENIYRIDKGVPIKI